MRKQLLSILLTAVLVAFSSSIFAEDDIVYENAYIKMPRDLVSNLQGKRSYIRTRIQLLTDRADLQLEIQDHIPLLHHTFMMIVIDKKAADIKTAAGKESLRKELLEAGAKVLDEKVATKGLLTDLFFTSFHVQ